MASESLLLLLLLLLMVMMMVMMMMQDWRHRVPLNHCSRVATVPAQLHSLERPSNVEKRELDGFAQSR